MTTALAVKEQAMVVPSGDTTLAIVVVDEQTRAAAVERVCGLKSLRSKIVEYWKPAKQKADQSKKELLAKEKEMLIPVDKDIAEQDESIKVYLRAEEAKRKEAQDKADAESRRVAEEARKQREAEQDKAISAGNIEKAVEIAEKPVVAPTPVVIAPLAPKTVRADAGTASARTEIKVEVTDLLLFMKHCAENNIIDMWDIRLGAVKTWVKNNKLTSVPGLSITDDIATAYRPTKQGTSQ